MSLAENDRLPSTLPAPLATHGVTPPPTRYASCHRRTDGCGDPAPGVRRIETHWPDTSAQFLRPLRDPAEAGPGDEDQDVG
ncbi:hypothetical protein [Streptomyces sp. Qhu_M48]|uniref:hypothetical protein n=1 Tax=Streptomyces sp. Qhu_M48 TaxID=3435889 RepID=UPI003F4F57D4